MPPTNDSQRTGLTFRVMGGMAWQAAGVLATTGLQLGVIAVLARLLGPREFGLIASATILFGLPKVFSEGGIGQYLVRTRELTGAKEKAGFALTFWINLALAATFFITAPLFADFFRSEELTLVIRAVTPLFLLNGLTTVARYLLERDLQFKVLAKLEILTYALGYGVVGIGLAWLGFGVWALVAALLAQEALRAVLLLTRRRFAKSLIVRFRPARKIISFSFGIGLGGVANYLALQGDYIVVGRVLGTAPLGYYSRAYRLMAQPANLFGKVVKKVLLPALSRLQDDRARLASAYGRGVALTALVALPLSAMIAVLGPEIVQVLLGPKWLAVVAPLQILTLGSYFRVGYKISGTLAVAMGAVYRAAWVQWVYAGLVIGGAWFGTRFGLPGVATCVVLALAIQFLLLSRLGLKLAGMSYGAFLGAHVPAGALAAVIALTSWLVALILRTQGVPAIAVLLAAAAAGSAAAATAARILPRVFLGRDGQWWIETLVSRAPARVRSTASRLLWRRDDD